MAREVEAILKLQAKLGNVAAFGAMARKIDALEAKTQRANRAQAIMNRTSAAYAKVAGVIGPAAVAYGAVQAIKSYAAVEDRLTRIALTAGQGKEAVTGMMASIYDTSQRVALSQDDVTGGLETLISLGMDAKDAMGFLPTVAATAKAAGASTDDMAATTMALSNAFKITGANAQEAFDILVAGGHAGAFELKDMAASLPSLAPAFANLGYTGTEGVAKLAATLQTLRMETGTAGEAATLATNVFGKMFSSDTAGKFKKFGIDLPKALNKAHKEGKDLLDVFLDLTETATKGDYTKIPLLFGDQQMQQGMGALLRHRDALDRLVEALHHASGATAKDLNEMLDTTNSKIIKLGNAWSRLKTSAGAFAVDTGAASLMDNTTGFMDFSTAVNAGLETSGVHGFRDRSLWGLGHNYAEKEWMARKGGRHAEGEADIYKLYNAYQDARREPEGGDLPALPKGRTGRQRLPRRGAPIPGARPDPNDDGGFREAVVKSDAKTLGALAVQDVATATALQETPAQRTQRIVLAEMADTQRRWNEVMVATGQDLSKAVPAPAASGHLWGAGAREADVASMNALNDPNIGRRTRNAIESSPADIDALRKAMEESGKAISDGGDHAGQSIKDAAQELNGTGEEIGAAINRMLDGIGPRIGADMANSFSANVRLPTVNVQGGGTLSGRAVGRSMPYAGTPASGAEGGRANGPGGNGGV